MKDILIIGLGPVGLYAVSCAGMLGLSGYAIDANNQVGGQPVELYADKNIYDIPGILKITGRKYVECLTQQAENNSNLIDWYLEVNIIDIETIPEGFKITLSNDEIIMVKTILITTGNGMFCPIKLDQLPTDQTFTNLDYAIKNIEKYNNKKIVIFGGGDSAVDWANHFAEAQISTDINIVHRRNYYRAQTKNVNKLSTNKITEWKNYHISDIQIDKNEVKSITIIHNEDNTNKVTFEKCYFIIQFGAKLSPSIIQTLDLNFSKTRKIVSSPSGKTNIKNIFVAGNASYYEGKYYNMVSGFGECINSLVNITKVLYGEKYHPGYLGEDLPGND